MNKWEALNILNLPTNATWEQIDIAYNQLRQFYCPVFYGSGHDYTDKQIQEEIYAALSHDYYKAPKGVQYRDFVPDAYHYAFFQYSQVCRAYQHLLKLKENNQLDCDPNTPYGYDVIHYGKTVAFFREKIPAMRCLTNKWIVLGYLVFGLIGSMINRDSNFFSIVAEVLKYLYIALFVGQWITMPLDMLLLIPKMMWDGMRKGASIGIWLTKPITIALIGVLYGIGGALSMFFFPALAMLHRETRYDPPIKNAKKGRKMAEEIYQATLDNLDAFRFVDPPYIDDSIPVIRKAMEKIASKYRSAQSELRSTQAYHDDDVAWAGKLLDWNLDGDVEWDADNYGRALDRRDREVSIKEREVNKEAHIFYYFLNRLGADEEDYIKQK